LKFGNDQAHNERMALLASQAKFAALCSTPLMARRNTFAPAFVTFAALVAAAHVDTFLFMLSGLSQA
jgi:hypothetical protein